MPRLGDLFGENCVCGQSAANALSSWLCGGRDFRMAHPRRPLATAPPHTHEVILDSEDYPPSSQVRRTRSNLLFYWQKGDDAFLPEVSQYAVGYLRIPTSNTTYGGSPVRCVGHAPTVWVYCNEEGDAILLEPLRQQSGTCAPPEAMPLKILINFRLRGGL